MAGLVVGELAIKVSLNKKGLSNDMAGCEAIVEQGAEKLSKSWAVSMGIISSLTSKIFNGITSTIDSALGSAIKRVDTLNNSNRVFEALGYSTDSVNSTMERLKGYLDGLPTSMTDAVSGVQSLAASFGGIEKGTDYYIAMNDAGLAFGATTDMIANAITQLGQTSLDGPLDAETWNSLRNSGFAPVFAAMAEEAGTTVGQLKSDFGGHGTRTVQDFLDTLMRLDKEGSGSMKSLSNIARENTAGIGTALENVENRAGKAIAKIIEEIGPENIAGAINTFSSSFSSAADIVVGALELVKDNASWLVPVVGGLTAAFVTYEGVTNAAAIVTGVMSAAQKVLNLVMSANPIGIVVAAITGLIVALVGLWNNCEGFRDFIMGAIDTIGKAFGKIGEFIGGVFKSIGETAGKIFESIGNFVGETIDGIKSAFKGAWDFITGLFSKIGGFFNGIWETVKGIFTSIGTTIGDAVGGAFKAVVNGIIGFAESFINAPVRAINTLIGVINAIPGIELGYLDELQLPRMAQGGIIPGNSYSGDRNMIMANSGEMVITRQQQAALWDAIEHGAFATENGGEVTNIDNTPIEIKNTNYFSNELDIETFNDKMVRELRTVAL